MTDLPEVRRADCGHGFLPIDTPPAARQQNGQHEQPVYLCEDCRARLQAPKVERKVVEPDRTQVTLKHRAESRRDDFRPDPTKLKEETPAQRGRRAAIADDPRRVPEGMHPRSREGREFLAAYDEAKTGG